MRRPWHGAMPLTVTLPLGLARRLSARQRRWRRIAVGTLIALGVGLLAAGFWLPARADLSQQFANGAWNRSVATGATVTKARPKTATPRVAPFALPAGGGPLNVAAARLATLAIGDELVVARPDGSTLTYAVTGLDVIDSERVQFEVDADASIVVLVTRWPFDAVTVGGSWRYVVTARQRF